MYAEQFQIVFRFLLSLSRDWGLAEELTQETFYKAMKGLDGYRGDSKASTWLCQIAKNTYYSHLRKHGRTMTGGPRETGFAGSSRQSERRASRPLERGGNRSGVSGDDGLTALLQREDSEALHRAIHALPDPYKEVFTLRVLAALDYGQIAGLFGKSENWARVTFYRAKMKLRERMEAAEDDP